MNVVVHYKMDGRWLVCIAAPGETYEEACAALKRRFPEIEDFRRHGEPEPATVESPQHSGV